MQWSTTTTDAKRVLRDMSRVIGGADRVQPVFGQARIDADAGTMSAVGWDATVTVTLPGELTGTGAAGIPVSIVAKHLTGTRRPIRLEAGDSECRVEGATFPTLPLEDMPTVRGTGEPVDRVPPGFADMLERVTYAVSRDEARPILTGIKLDADGTVSGTDSYRLIWAHDAAASLPDTLLPARELAAVVKAIGGLTWLGAAGAHVSVFGPNGAGTVRAIDGTFPQWRRLIPPPAQCVWTCTVDAADTLRMLTGGKTLAGDSHPVRLGWDVGPTGLAYLTMRVVRGEGEWAGSVPAQWAGGRPDTIPGVEPDTVAAFNYRYLSDMLEAIGPGRVHIHWSKDDSGRGAAPYLRPVTFTGDHGARGLLMPVRL